jgi:primosomal protein N' (replication factor Y)
MAIARVALPVAAWHLFDYWIPDGLRIAAGDVVRVRLSGRAPAGVVAAVDATSDYLDRVHPIEAVTDVPPLPAEIIRLVDFVSAYYQAPPGMAYALATPPLTRTRTRRGEERRHVDAAEDPVNADYRLTAGQSSAVAAIVATLGRFAPWLLHGVTGSGKTDVYLAAAAQAVENGGQVLILVPEINLTPQFEQRVRRALPAVKAATLHSRLAAGARRANWDAAATGDAKIVLATRLGVFVPLPALALVVVDEEHDDSFKQQDGVRYHARDLAVWRGRERNVPVVLGSATPSLETWSHAKAGHYRTLALATRADTRARSPDIAFTAVRGAAVRNGVSTMLREALAACTSRGEQALLFINRRGYAPSLKCASCAWESHCPRCAARLVVHRQPERLRCHHCGHVERAPRACPACGNVDLLPVGFGTQRLEQAIRAEFPMARVARVARDTTRNKGDFAAVRQRVEDRDVDILIGTQMLAKGHDFPRLTLVGVLGADNALYSADFRATERLAALLTQVSGRAGRAELRGTVIVQTDFPDHPVYRALARHDYARFADELLAERVAAQLPPASRIALLEAQAHARDDVDRFLDDAVARARSLPGASDGVEVFAPAPPTLSKRQGFERGQVLVQSVRRAALQAFLIRWRESIATSSAASRVRWAIDVDPAAF